MKRLLAVLFTLSVLGYFVYWLGEPTPGDWACGWHLEDFNVKADTYSCIGGSELYWEAESGMTKGQAYDCFVQYGEGHPDGMNLTMDYCKTLKLAERAYR